MQRADQGHHSSPPQILWMKQGMKSELCWVTMVTSITMKLSTMHMHQRRPAASSQDWCQQQPAS